MADLAYLALLLGFFALASGFVSLCDRIIGPDAAAGTLDEPDPAAADAAAPDPVEVPA